MLHLETHRRKKAIATLVLLPNPACEKFSVVKAGDGFLRGFGGMPARENFADCDPPLMFTGIQILEPEIFDYIPRGVFSHSTTDVYPQAMLNGNVWPFMSPLVAGLSSRRFNAIWTSVCSFCSERGETLTAGSECEISPGAEIAESVLWDRRGCGNWCAS